MYTVPQYEPWVELIGEDGSVSRYDNYKKFIEAASYYFVKNHLVLTFKDRAIKGLIYWGQEPKPLFILRDQFGSVFSPSEVIHDVGDYKWDNITKFRITYNKYHYSFRYGPVPYTGKRGGGNSFRRPHTTQERRYGHAHGKYVRPNRRPHALPNEWDDIYRSGIYHTKSWKNQKKRKQWM